MLVSEMTRHVFRRLNVKSGAMLIALIFGISGIAMVYTGIRDEGSIDFKMAIAEGKVKTGFVGVMVLFMSLIICMCCIFRKTATHTVEIKKGPVTLKWTGSSQLVGDEILNKFDGLFKKDP